jgi:hypothetical protein
MYMGMNNIIISFGTITVLALLLSFISCASNPIRNEGIIAEAIIDEYVGSSDCAECHEDKYDDWSQRLMSSFVRYKKDDPGSLPGDGV